MKKDIETRADIDRLMDEFYEVVMTDELIGHHFVDLDLETHLPIIASFWEKVLFGSPVYFGNPLAVHQTLHERSPLIPEHFDRWVAVFSTKVDELFEGEIAEAAKAKARMVALNMGHRLNGGVRIQSAK